MMRRILYIEDEECLREDLACELRDAGYDVSEAANGMEGIACGVAEPFDLVLCDVQLPKLDGVEVLRQLRGQECPRGQVPVIMLSAYADAAMRRQCEELCVADFIVKPVDFDELITLIGRITGHPSPSS